MGLLKELGLAPARHAANAATATDPTDAGAAQRAWSTARSSAIGQLRALGAAIRRTGDPAGEALIVLLQAMTKNFAPTLRDGRHADELEKYLREDELLADAETPNPFGIVVDVRRPLLEALSASRAALPE